MSLISRLVAPGPSEEAIPIHQFMAAVAELKRGSPSLTMAEVVTAFDLSAAEEDELEALVNSAYLNQVSRERVHDVLMLGAKSIYTVQEVEDRLVNQVDSTDLWPMITHRAFQVMAKGVQGD